MILHLVIVLNHDMLIKKKKTTTTKKPFQSKCSFLFSFKSCTSTGNVGVVC